MFRNAMLVLETTVCTTPVRTSTPKEQASTLPFVLWPLSCGQLIHNWLLKM